MDSQRRRTQVRILPLYPFNFKGGNMGTYTELVLKCRLKRDMPKEALDVFDYLFGLGEKPATLPKHNFFSLPRWELVGRCSSYYHHPEAVNSYTEWRIFSRSDLKNYDDEIENFLDWAKPYIYSASDRGCIGWTWYEEANEPTLIFEGEV